MLDKCHRMKEKDKKGVHPSMRGWFAYELHKQMTLDTDIVLITFDLGFGMWDEIRDNYPKRFYNLGVSEQAGMDIAVGMALSGKKVFVYSITNFLLYRPFETLQTYINYEKIPIKLVASGRNKDYIHDGISHWSEDAKPILDCLPNIKQLWPESKEEIPLLVEQMVKSNDPIFISLKR